MPGSASGALGLYTDPMLARRTMSRTQTPLALAAAAAFYLGAGCATPAAGPPAAPSSPAATIGSRPADLDSDVRTVDGSFAPEGPIDATGNSTGNATGNEIDAADASMVDPSQPELMPAQDSTIDPATQPAPGEASAQADGDEDGEANPARSDGYRTVGGLVTYVNNEPIFSDEILAPIERSLEAKAKELNRDAFQRYAESEIMRNLQLQVQDRKFRVVAQKFTTIKEKQLAQQLAVTWRTNYITDSGGSEAIARQRAIDENDLTLDKLSEDEYFRLLYQIFNERRIRPLVQPSAAELRAFYRENQATFESPATLNFALIEFRPEDSSDRALIEARIRAAEVLKRALQGEDFGDLAEEFNEDPSYKARRGKLPEVLIPLQRGSYVSPEIEQAAWDQNAGEVSDVLLVERNGSPRLYLVKTLERNEPKTASFESVQSEISEVLRRQNMDQLIDGYFAELDRSIQLPSNEQQQEMLVTTLEIIMQQYDQWQEDTAGDTAENVGDESARR